MNRVVSLLTIAFCLTAIAAGASELPRLHGRIELLESMDIKPFLRGPRAIVGVRNQVRPIG